MNTQDRKELPNKLANQARKIAFQKKVATNKVLQPMLLEHGFEDENGVNLETYSITIGLFEDLDKVPSKETMEDFDLL